VLGLFDGQETAEHRRISTEARRTADEPAMLSLRPIRSRRRPLRVLRRYGGYLKLADRARL